MKRRAILLSAFAVALTGCFLAQIIAFPFKLLFEGIGRVGSGVGSVLGMVAVIEPGEVRDAGRGEQRDGPAPTLRALGDDRFLVEAPTTPGRFRIRFSASGYADRVMTWPDDFSRGEGALGRSDACAATGDAGAATVGERAATVGEGGLPSPIRVLLEAVALDTVPSGIARLGTTAR